MSSLIADNDNSEQVWQDEQTALSDLKQGGWSIEVSASTLYAEDPDQPCRELWGYVLRWNVH